MLAIVSALVAAVFSSSKNLVSKKIAESQTGIISACASFFYALPYYFVLLAITVVLGWESIVFTKAFLSFVILRSLTDAAAEWLKMQSMVKGEISLLVGFQSLAPLFLLVTSPIITGDPLSMHAVLGIFFIVAGCLWMTGFRFQRLTADSKVAVLLALGSSLFFSLNSCFDRLAVQEAGPVLSGFAMTVVAGFLLLPFAFRSLKHGVTQLPQREFFLRGFFEVAFMVLKLFAMQTYDAPVVIGVMKISLLFSIIGGKVLYGDKDFLIRLKAGLLILVGVLVIILGEL